MEVVSVEKSLLKPPIILNFHAQFIANKKARMKIKSYCDSILNPPDCLFCTVRTIEIKKLTNTRSLPAVHLTSTRDYEANM